MVFERGPLWRRIADYVESIRDVHIAAGKHLVLPQNNGAASPTLAFGDGDTGFYEGSDGVITTAIEGNTRWIFANAFFGRDVSTYPNMRYAVSSATSPVFCFGTDSNTGLGTAAADQVSLIAGGVEGIRVTEAAGAIALSSPASYRHIERISSSQIGLPSSNPPLAVEMGITPGLKFTVNTDKVAYKKVIPGDWDGTDLLVHVHWTKSTADDDQSAKFVKWQLKWLSVGDDENCNSGETTLTVEDEYPSAVTTTQVIAKTANVTIPLAGVAAHDTLVLQLMAVTPAGTALDDEPIATAVDIDIGRYILHG